MPLDYLPLIDEITAPLPPMPVARLGTPPWEPIAVALERARVMILSSAGVHLRDDPPFEPTNDLTVRRIPAGVAPSALRPSHPSPIRRPGMLDVNVVHPYERLAELAASGEIGGVTDHHLSILGAIKTLVPVVEEMGPHVASEARESGADLVLLVPLCPACHQSVGILARAVERAGIPTMTLVGARDITALVRPPRAAFLDFPLGNSAGRPRDATGQRRICVSTLRLAAAATVPGEIVDLDERWPVEGWERHVVDAYRGEAEIVTRQRMSEFGADGSHLAAADVAAVEAMI
ncbi:MAG TPA: hypothetical protein VND23_00205 [Acidimicrobiales bacterium]|nr:hypothetical protein [Acidimicrobiales bacterium]